MKRKHLSLETCSDQAVGATVVIPANRPPRPNFCAACASLDAQVFDDPASPAFPPANLDLACDVDRYDFPMPGRRQAELLILEKVLPEDLPGSGAKEKKVR